MAIIRIEKHMYMYLTFPKMGAALFSLLLMHRELKITKQKEKSEIDNESKKLLLKIRN